MQNDKISLQSTLTYIVKFVENCEKLYFKLFSVASQRQCYLFPIRSSIWNPTDGFIK